MYVHTNKNSSSWCTSKMTVMWSVHPCLYYIIKWNRDFSMSLRQRYEWENKNKWKQKYYRILSSKALKFSNPMMCIILNPIYEGYYLVIPS